VLSKFIEEKRPIVEVIKFENLIILADIEKFKTDDKIKKRNC